MKCVEIWKELDNRSPDNLEVERIFLRIYIDRAPWRVITWERDEESYYDSMRFKEIDADPDNFKFPKDKRDCKIRLLALLPPYTALDKRIYINHYGYMVMKSSFGSFKTH